ncbi:pantoate--beta-alanine ligase [Actinospica sp. MGRD01-02]|uniref:Pantothenate synthetase n=1 Tax=Actinospica acidithermotolerans TaxID=2828514 RepID=A0A941EGM4_9ACTN|nr:pantoate--beta-alanine ligase [Actinospica acidithermotolerans]MBR7830043.1 pantoate--beta-alanine ligase [Actinospica acidithermotolerans]
MSEKNPGSTLLVHTRAELEAARAGRIGDVAVVMTMGALHEGHLTLIRAARQAAKTVVVTVFVNPLQFGPNEDFSRYPRTLDADVKLCEQAEADIVFAPAVEDVYPGGEPMVRITPGPMGEVLEGAYRPGHFSGMLTVVNKLLNLTAPDYAYFGEKDAQQLALIRRMALDLNLPVEIRGVPTVREPDGLALSSRNRFLSPAERASALYLSKALFAGVSRRTPAEIRRSAQGVLEQGAQAEPPIRPDYLALVDPETFAEVDEAYRGPAVLALAAKVGATRLIDNLPLRIEG